MRSIIVTLSPDAEVARPDQNPLEVGRGETVIWSFQDPDGQPVLAPEVVFQLFVPEQRGATPIVERAPFNGSFSPTVGATIAANAEPGLYIYSLIDDQGQTIKWTTPLFTVGSFGAFFGGIRVEDPPRPRTDS